MKLPFFHMCFGHSIAKIDNETTTEISPESNKDNQQQGMSRINPVVRTYLYPSDITSTKRYFLLLFAIWGGFIWWLGPVLGLFVVDPMIQLMLLDYSVITPATQCFDHRLPNQTCDTDVMVDYYFWNMTNSDAWLAGSSPPAYDQVGPYAFRAKEVRYNMKYDPNWTHVEYTYHQYVEFLPETSCPTCTLNNSITSINRAYLQFLSAAPASSPIDPETGVIYQLMPITLSIVKDSIKSAVSALNPASTTIEQDTVKQWTDCSFLVPFVPLFGLQTPYLKDVPMPPGTPPYPYNPELCAYIPQAVKGQTGMTITPSDFAPYGLSMDYTATTTFLALAIGQSNATYVDPAALQFLLAFMTLPQSTVLQLVGAASPPAAAALKQLTPTQWLLLKGYVSSLVPTWGTLVYQQWIVGGGGGLLLTHTIDTWLNGYNDPLLVAGAQAMYASAPNPTAYLLQPWLFRPSLGLTFPSANAPLDYFEQITGTVYNFSMLTWNSSEIGRFHPLIQQKKIATGKSRGDTPQYVLEYNGRPFFNKTFAIINTTGVNEGVYFGSNVDKRIEQTTWDSVLSRPISIQYVGYKTNVKDIATILYNMTTEATAACNWTYYGDWAGHSAFDPDAYTSLLNDIPLSDYWSIMDNVTGLQSRLASSPFGTLDRYFNTVDIYRDRCAVPDSFSSMWSMSQLLACPTMYTFPRFFDAANEVVNSTGVKLSSWNPDFQQHGYSLAVEPFTGIAVKGHKTYQINHLVSNTTNAYKTVWVAPGTAAIAGMPKDFVTVPTYWVRMWWEPTDAAAMVLRNLSTANDVLYYMLVVSCPIFGWLMLGPALFMLRFSKEAKTRRKELPKIQKSRARPLRLTGHEVQMVEGLHRIARGSIGVVLPESIPEGHSEIEETETSLGGEGGRDGAVQYGSCKVVPIVVDSSTGSGSGTTINHGATTGATGSSVLNPSPVDCSDGPLMAASHHVASKSSSGSGGTGVSIEAPLLRSAKSTMMQ